MFDDLDPGFHKRAWYRHRTPAERLRNAGIPKAIRRQIDAVETLTKAQQKMVLTAEEWVAASPRTTLNGVNLEGTGFIVSGTRQTGKTVGAASMLMKLVDVKDAPVSGRYTTAAALCEMFNDSVRNNGILGNEWVDPYLLDAISKRFDIVVIDDFGIEPLSEFRIDSMYSLMRHRAAALLPTIIVMHSKLRAAGDIDERYGEDFAAFLNTFPTITCQAP